MVLKEALVSKMRPQQSISRLDWQNYWTEDVVVHVVSNFQHYWAPSCMPLTFTHVGRSRRSVEFKLPDEMRFWFRWWWCGCNGRGDEFVMSCESVFSLIYCGPGTFQSCVEMTGAVKSLVGFESRASSIVTSLRIWKTTQHQSNQWICGELWS